MSDIFAEGFLTTPYWWEAAPPTQGPVRALPDSVDVAVVGGGYAGLSTALELARNGNSVCVLEAESFGHGASSRNGGMVSAGVNLAKGIDMTDSGSETLRHLMSDASKSMSVLEMIIEREAISCHYSRSGRFTGAWTQKHYDAMAARVEVLNAFTQSGASMLPRDRQRSAIGSDYYHGGMLPERAAGVHPALLLKGLKEAAERAGAILVSNCPATGLVPQVNGGHVAETPLGRVRAREIVLCTNGYTGNLSPNLRRRLIPVASYMIATEPLPRELVEELVPKGRMLGDSKRVLCYFRQSPDGTRILFGGRASFRDVSAQEAAPRLFKFMTDVYPQLQGKRITHAWRGNVAFAFDYLPHMGRRNGVHYTLACNGNGVAMMTYLGYQTARKLLGKQERPSAFDTERFPTYPFYGGNPWFLPIVGNTYRLLGRVDKPDPASDCCQLHEAKKARLQLVVAGGHAA